MNNNRKKVASKKRPVGQPLKYTPASLQSVINSYFAVTPIEEYTITGLALKLGSRQLIQDYEKRKNYTEIIKKAKLQVENAYELSLRKTGKSGDIFALKNFGWKDQQDITQNIALPPQITIICGAIQNDLDSAISSISTAKPKKLDVD